MLNKILNQKTKKKKIGPYLFTEQIGSGQFGKVYKAIDQNNELYAIKEVSKETLYLKSKLKELFYSELKDVNIVKHVDYLESEENCYLVMEYCNGGDLESLLLIKGYLEESEAIIHFEEILHGFQCMQKHNIVHRDFKAANVFIQNGIFKIGDFGFAKIVNPNSYAGTILVS